jgi:peptide/nickel transport system substrate-binding protein
LLAGAGWTMGPDGVLQKDGKDLRFSLVTNDDPVRGRIAAFLVDSWKKLGVRAELSSMGPAGLIQNHLAPRRYEAVLYGLDTGYDPDAYPLWHSSQRGENQLNISGYSNRQVDAKLEQARQTNDMDLRRKLYGEFQAAFAEEAPALLLYHPRYTYVVDKKVQGVAAGVLYETSSRFYDVRNWYIQTKRVLKRR